MKPPPFTPRRRRPVAAVERFLNNPFPPVVQLGRAPEEIPAGDRALARPDHAARGRSRTEARPHPRSLTPNRRDARDSQTRVPASRRRGRPAHRRVDAFVLKTGGGGGVPGFTPGTPLAQAE